MKRLNNVAKKFIMCFTIILSLSAIALPVYAQGDEAPIDVVRNGGNSSGNSDDDTPPTLNGAINNGKLRVEAFDESGIKAIYVNGYEFIDPLDGILTIRLEKFEASKEFFTIAAMDNAGNRSQDYYLTNPYWVDPNNEDGDNSAADALPADASATDPSQATGTVTDHVKTDADGNLIQEADDNFYYTGENDPSFGREFYTIQTATGKVFYLIVERDDNNETVHFVTDITENDLLNATSNNSEVLPKNSLATNSSKPLTEIAIPSNDGGTITVDAEGNKTVRDANGNVVEPEEEEAGQGARDDAESVSENGAGAAKKKNPIIIYIIVGAAFFAVAYYVKIVKPKKQAGFVEDEEAAEEMEAEQYADDEIVEQPGNYFSREQSDEDFITGYDPNDDGGNS